MSKNLKEWDLQLPHAKLAYNQAPTYATSHFPYEAYYRVNPLTPINIFPFSIENRVSFKAYEIAKEMKKVHEQIRIQIEKVNASY